jgi:hypothetical protein
MFPFFGLRRDTHGPDGDALDRSGVFFEALFPLFFAQARLTGMIEAQEMQRGKLFGMTA